jgi:hypothetical protein
VTSTIDQVSTSLSAAASTHVDAIVIVLLLALLAEQELVRAYQGGSTARRLRTMWVVMVPLAAAFVLIVSVRVLGLR